MKTTLNKIRENDPCEGSWKKLLSSMGKEKADDSEVSIKYILQILGLKDAIWALRCVEGHDKEIRLFACDCAESVLLIYENKYPKDNRPRYSIETSRRFANGNSLKGELKIAADAAADAAAEAAAEAAAYEAAAETAAEAAEAAAYEAADAAAEAADDDERTKQEQLLLKYL